MKTLMIVFIALIYIYANCEFYNKGNIVLRGYGRTKLGFNKKRHSIISLKVYLSSIALCALYFWIFKICLPLFILFMVVKIFFFIVTMIILDTDLGIDKKILTSLFQINFIYFSLPGKI